MTHPFSTSIANTKDKTRQRVLIVENKSLLGAGVEDLLIYEVDLDLVGIAPTAERELIRYIQQFQPDVVILDQDSGLTNPTRLLALLKDYSELRLVAVSANDNMVYVFDKQQTLVTGVNDLIGVIRR